MKKPIIAVALILCIALMLCSCSAKAAPLSDIFSQIKAETGLTDLVEFDDVSDLERLYGIDAADVREFAGGVNNSGVDQEEIVLIKATDLDATLRIESALNNRYNSKLNETKSYNPEQYAIVEKCAVEVRDDQISMIISPNADAIKSIYTKGIGTNN